MKRILKSVMVVGCVLSQVSAFHAGVGTIRPSNVGGLHDFHQQSFQRSQSAGASLIRNSSSSSTSLHVLADGVSQQDDKIIQKIDKEMEKMEQHRRKVVEELNKANARLAEMRSKKQSYLEGQSLGKTPPGGSFTETTARSAVKSMMWRVIAGSITFITSMRFSGSMSTALSIVGSDFISKAATMFIGERLMNKSSAGRNKGADGVGRSLAKALIWRLFAIANTLTMAIFIAKDISIASKIAGSDAIFKTALMFFYERAWAKVEWGKEYQIDFFI